MPSGKNKIKNVFLAGFIFSLHLALVAYINSSFLSKFFGESMSGIAYVIGSILSIVALLLAPKLLKKTGTYKFTLALGAIDAVCLLLLGVAESAWLAIPAFVLYFTINTLIIFSLDELLEIFSKDSSTGKIRGLYLTLVNLAWVISQGVSGKLLGGFSFSTVYLVASIIMVTFLFVTFKRFKGLPEPRYDKARTWSSIKEFFKNKNLARAYKMNFLLQFFFSWMVIYTPLYLSAHLGFSWKDIGIIFTIMLLPFVLVQFPLGKYSDKIGERAMLVSGFAIAGISTLFLFFLGKNEIWFWAGGLFATRVGAAIIEVMSDVYFFKHIKAENDEFIGIYRNTIPVSYILGPLCAVLAFYFIPSFEYIYVLLGVIMLYGVYLASTIRKGDR